MHSACDAVVLSYFLVPLDLHVGSEVQVENVKVLTTEGLSSHPNRAPCCEASGAIVQWSSSTPFLLGKHHFQLLAEVQRVA